MLCCSICLLPFVHEPVELQPPKGMLTPPHMRYLTTGIAVGSTVPDVLCEFDALKGNNMIGKPFSGVFLRWEYENRDGCFTVLHITCATLLRHHFNVGPNPSAEDLLKLCEIQEAIGIPYGGQYAGRFRSLNYEEIGPPDVRVDMRHFWSLGPGPGLNVFGWLNFAGTPVSWAIAKPDAFPRFFPEVMPERLQNLHPVPDQSNRFLRLPFDIMNMTVSYLPTKAFVQLMSTCRTLRRQALTVFQPQARLHVLSLKWATPLGEMGEYDAAVKRNPQWKSWLVHTESSPVEGDWMLYLSHVHRTNAMRARRRIWYICEALKELVDKELPTSKYGRNLAVERPKLKQALKNQMINAEGMRRLTALSEQGWEDGPAHERVTRELGIPRFPVR